MVRGSLALVLSGLTTDTRRLEPGRLFVALEGERFDGHDFAERALQEGAGGVLVRFGWSEGRELPFGGLVVEVNDTLTALGLLARWWRLQHRIPILAVSGSMGKTSVKEMIASIMSVSHRVLKTEGNLNNLIGLPLTLFRLEAAHEMAVVELGVSLPGEMERLVDIARPQAGLLTNVAPVHLAGLGGLDGVARAKTALWRGMNGDAVAVVNLDDPRLREAAKDFPGPKVTFGASEAAAEADVRLAWVEHKGLDGQGLEMIVRGERDRFFLPAVGDFYGLNAAAACAGALALGADIEEMAEGLRHFSQPGHRMRPLKGVGGLTIIDDAYNANPEAMRAVMETLIRIKPNGNRLAAILGQMAELGEAAEEAHRQLGQDAGRLGIDPVIAVGPWSGQVVEGARQGGASEALEADDAEQAAALVRQRLASGDWLLIKGSRVAGLERAVAALTGEDDGT